MFGFIMLLILGYIVISGISLFSSSCKLKRAKDHYARAKYEHMQRRIEDGYDENGSEEDSEGCESCEDDEDEYRPHRRRRYYNRY